VSHLDAGDGLVSPGDGVACERCDDGDTQRARSGEPGAARIAVAARDWQSTSGPVRVIERLAVDGFVTYLTAAHHGQKA
jgi:hypothetical protein